MQAPRKHAVQVGATLTASGNSGNLKNLGLSASPDVVICVAVHGAVVGTSPTLQVTLYTVDDLGNMYQVWQGASIIATNTFQRQQIVGTIDPTFYVSWVIGGSGGPSFAGVDITLYMSSPDL